MCQGGQFYCKNCKIWYWKGNGLDDYIPCEDFQYCKLSNCSDFETDFCGSCLVTKIEK